MDRYELDRLRKLEQLERRWKNAIVSPEDELDDAAIIAKKIHRNSVEASDELLRLLKLHHKDRDKE